MEKKKNKPTQNSEKIVKYVLMIKKNKESRLQKEYV